MTVKIKLVIENFQIIVTFDLHHHRALFQVKNKNYQQTNEQNIHNAFKY